MPADRTVVSDLDQIVDFGAFADDRVARGAPIDRRIGADFDVVLNDGPPRLRDFLVTLRRRQIAEAVLADACAGMDDHPVADQSVQDRSARADRAVAADTNVGSYNHARSDQRVRSDLGARPDNRERIDGHAGLESRRRMNLRTRGAPVRIEQGRRPQHVRERACGRWQQRRDRDAAFPAPPVRAAPPPQTAAQSGRRRPVSWRVRPKTSNCRES